MSRGPATGRTDDYVLTDTRTATFAVDRLTIFGAHHPDAPRELNAPGSADLGYVCVDIDRDEVSNMWVRRSQVGNRGIPTLVLTASTRLIAPTSARVSDLLIRKEEP